MKYHTIRQIPPWGGRGEGGLGGVEILGMQIGGEAGFVFVPLTLGPPARISLPMPTVS